MKLVTTKALPILFLETGSCVLHRIRLSSLLSPLGERVVLNRSQWVKSNLFLICIFFCFEETISSINKTNAILLPPRSDSLQNLSLTIRQNQCNDIDFILQWADLTGSHGSEETQWCQAWQHAASWVLPAELKALLTSKQPLKTIYSPAGARTPKQLSTDNKKIHGWKRGRKHKITRGTYWLLCVCVKSLFWLKRWHISENFFFSDSVWVSVHECMWKPDPITLECCSTWATYLVFWDSFPLEHGALWFVGLSDQAKLALVSEPWRSFGLWIPRA